MSVNIKDIKQKMWLKYRQRIDDKKINISEGYKIYEETQRVFNQNFKQE